MDTIVVSPLPESLESAATAALPTLTERRHHLHRHPELSNREVQTSALVADTLRAAGLDEVRTGIAGHGVVGVLRGGKPGDRTPLLRADMDALPVRERSGVDFASTVVDETYPGGPFPVAHSCGHDCHTAVVLTVAEVLAAQRDKLPGTVVFAFQPAEEGPPPGETGGAEAMLDTGVFDDLNPTMAFGMHVTPLPRGVVGYAVGNEHAGSCLVRIIVRGKQVHGSTPWLGIDPMPPAAAIIGAIGQLYRQVAATDAITVTIGHVEDVGRFNIIGESVTLWGTVRALEQADMTITQQNLRRLAEHQALAYGATATVDYLQDVPPVTNTAPWLDAILPTVRGVLGADNVVPIPPTLSYDDVSVFLNAFGGVYLRYGVQDTYFGPDGGLHPIVGGRGFVANHNPAFYADDDSLLSSLRIHLAVAYQHLIAGDR